MAPPGTRNWEARERTEACTLPAILPEDNTVPILTLSRLASLAFCLLALVSNAVIAAPPKKLVLMAGKPSHPPRMHEFNAGVQLLAGCLDNTPGLETTYLLNGWPDDDAVLREADAIVFYMDGLNRHEIVQQSRSRLDLIDELADRGVGLGFMHFAVEVAPDQAGRELTKWIGGHYEAMFSCNPIWEPEFKSFPVHPITRGVHPFTIKDEWYFNMRFIDGLSGNSQAAVAGLTFTPILVATPSDDVRDGPYVHPKGPYPHIVEQSGRPEAMMWAVERPSGGRGFGFTGGHFHDNWGNDDFRKVVLNACLWAAEVEVPAEGVASTLSPTALDANLDPKKKR